MIKLRMFAGRLLCTPDQISFNFFSEYSNKNESKAPCDGKLCIKRSPLPNFTAFSNSSVLRYMSYCKFVLSLFSRELGHWG